MLTVQSCLLLSIIRRRGSCFSANKTHSTDGTDHHCDILVGADGIRSVLRKTILGEDDPATSPRNSGWWAVWTLQPYQEARSLLGEERTNIDDPREYIWVGNGTFLMHNVLSDGQLVQLVLTGHDQQEVDGAKWQRAVSAETLRDLFQGSLPHLKNAIEEVSLKRTLLQISLWPCFTLCTNEICSCFANNLNSPPYICGIIRTPGLMSLDLSVYCKSGLPLH